MKKRRAVSVLLTRDPDSTEAYLVERNPELKFFGGYYAFPGGTLDAEDEDVGIKNQDAVSSGSISYVFAAVREIFEETGILLTHGDQPIPADKLNSYRKQILENETSLQEVLRRENHHIDGQDFHFIATILTPEFAPVRYDTEFYWAKIPSGSNPEIWQGELIDGDFYTADEAVKQWKTGKMMIVPPVIFMLWELQGRSVQTFTPVIREHAEAYRRGKIHQVFFAPGVQLIALQTRTLPPATHTNTYLVGDKKLYIVDPGPADANEQNRLWDYLDDRLAEGCKFAGILLTHHHSDHIGALQECQRRYDLPILAHKNTADKLPGFEFDTFLQHGDELDLGPAPDGSSDWKLTVHHTPGHASGHLAFKESRYGTVLAGDLISTLSTIVISPPDGNMTEYLSSLELLESITEGILYPGHGPAVRDGKQVVQYYIKHRKQREQKLLQALNDEAQTVHDLVSQVYNDADPAIWPLAEHSLRAGLLKLAGEGKCREVEKGFIKV